MKSFKSASAGEDAAATLRRATELHRSGHADAAESLYRQVLQRQPRNSDALHYLGVLLAQAGRLEEALEHLKKARKARATDALISLDLGNAYSALGQLDEAERCFRRAIALQPKFPGGYVNLAILCEGRMRLAEAEALYREAIKLDPGLVDAWINLGNTLQALGRLDEAEQAFRTALELGPDRAEIHVNLGNLFRKQDRADAADECYRKALALDAGNANALYNLALLREQRGEISEAIERYREALRVHPEFPEAYANLGTLLEQEGRTDEAVQCLRRALALEPQSADHKFNLANALLSAGNYAEVEALLTAVLASNPGDVDALNQLGVCLERQGRAEDARRAFESALAADAGSTEAMINLAALFHEQKDRMRAAAMLRQAMEADPECADAFWQMGRFGYLEARFREARSWYERALAIEPRHELATFDMGLIDLLEGDLVAGWPRYCELTRKTIALRIGGAGITSDASLPPDLAGKSVELKCEQGIGDELLFLRYAATLKQRGAAVRYRASGKLAALLRVQPGPLDAVYAWGEEAPPSDVTMFVSALPAALGALEQSAFSARSIRNKDAHPASTRFRFPVTRRVFWPELPPPFPLKANPARVEAMRARLSQLGAPPYIGLTWRAGVGQDARLLNKGVAVLNKEIPLRELALALRGTHATLLALQRQSRPGELAELRQLTGRDVHDFSAFNEELDDVLALLTAIDEYVGVSNTNMHLMAGLGGTARVLMPCPPEWRWMAWGEESPWFPGFRIYRQRGDKDWSSAVARLREDLLAAHGRR